MKILFVDLGDVWGGQEIYSLTLAKELIARGFHVKMASVHMEHKLKGAEFLLLKKGFRNFLFNTYKVWPFMADIDIVHYNGIRSAYFGMMLPSRCAKIFSKHLPEKHGSLISRSALRSSILPLMAAQFNKVIAISTEIHENLLERGVRNSVVILNGVNDLWDDAPIGGRDPKRIIYVGRLVTHKGPMLLLEAIKCLVDDGVDVICDILGTGPLESEIRAFVHANGLSENVTVRGFCDQPASFLNKSTFQVLMSDHEGLPLSILEAMSCGCVVIASNIRANRQVIQHGVNGLIIEKKLSCLVQILKELFLNEALVLKLAREARRDYEERWSASRMVDDHITVYNEVVGKK